MKERRLRRFNLRKHSHRGTDNAGSKGAKQQCLLERTNDNDIRRKSFAI